MSNELKHVNLARINSASSNLSAIADKVYQEGGSPRAQIDEARKFANRPLSYNAHQGMKERMKRIKQMEKKNGK